MNRFSFGSKCSICCGYEVYDEWKHSSPYSEIIFTVILVLALAAALVVIADVGLGLMLSFSTVIVLLVVTEFVTNIIGIAVTLMVMIVVACFVRNLVFPMLFSVFAAGCFAFMFCIKC